MRRAPAVPSGRNRGVGLFLDPPEIVGVAVRDRPRGYAGYLVRVFALGAGNYAGYPGHSEYVRVPGSRTARGPADAAATATTPSPWPSRDTVPGGLRRFWERKWERRSAASYGQVRSDVVMVAVWVALMCSNVVKQRICWPERSVRDEVLRGFRFSDRTYPVNGGRLAAARRRRSSIQREMSVVSAPALMHTGRSAGTPAHQRPGRGSRSPDPPPRPAGRSAHRRPRPAPQAPRPPLRRVSGPAGSYLWPSGDQGIGRSCVVFGDPALAASSDVVAEPLADGDAQVAGQRGDGRHQVVVVASGA